MFFEFHESVEIWSISLIYASIIHLWLDLISDRMDSIYFEKQESLMCGQHALNMLLQSDYFSAQDLAEIARRLDSLERHFMDREVLFWI